MTSIIHSSFPQPNAAPQRDRVAFVQACWHRDIVDQLRDSFINEFSKLSDQKVDCFEVAGSFEIPLHAKYLANSGKYAAVVAAGLVVDGGIYRHDFVARTVVDGLMRVQMDTGTPVFSAVLTPHDFMSEGQPEFFKQHFVKKGAEAAVACADTLDKLVALAS
ncbi:MAG: 6,7-dimethyl-8-ribityllumazine synthase [Gammaproteobacteria bacterium]|nr:6,7-dimethyl-8-ribityllumazine synthase [Gammaproteobacteria bacterium]